MPSGSHRSSGRSGSRGSGRSSSSYRSSRSSTVSSSRSRHHYGRTGGVVVYHDRRGRTLHAVSTSFIPVIILLLIFIIACSVAISSYAKSIEDIKTEYTYYNQMINRAKSNPEYTIKADVTAMFESNGKYYITYTIDEKGYSDDWGVSFPIYTLGEASDLVDNGITLALAKKYSDMTMFTDSVPIDHTPDKMTIDSDYTNCKKMRLICIILDSILITIEIVFVVFLVRSIMAKRNEEKSGGENSQEFEFRCAHCGASYPSGANKCSSCGSSDRIRVNIRGGK